MTHVLTVVQVLGVVAVLIGLVLALPLGVGLVVGGLLVTVLATAGELALTGRRGAPSAARSGPRGSGAS